MISEIYFKIQQEYWEFWGGAVDKSGYRLITAEYYCWTNGHLLLFVILFPSVNQFKPVVFKIKTKSIYCDLCYRSSPLYRPRHFRHCRQVRLVTQPCLTLCDPQTVACSPPLFAEFSRQEYWSRQPLRSPGDLPDLGIEPGPAALLEADSLPSEAPGKPFRCYNCLSEERGPHP